MTRVLLQPFMGATLNNWAVIGRFVFSTCILLGWLQRLPWVLDVLGPGGIGGATDLRAVPEAALPMVNGSSLSLLKHIDSAPFVLSIYAITVVGAALLILGRRTTLAAVMCIGGHVLLMGRAPLVHWGWSFMVGPFLLWCLLGGGARSMGQLAPVAWRRVLQVHVCTMYLVPGFDRFDNPEWLNGETLFMAMTDMIFARVDIDFTFMAPILVVGSYGTLLLEPLAPILLWFKRTRRIVVVLLMAMHIGIEITADTGWWHVMAVAALFAFVSDDEMRKISVVFQRLKKRLASKRATAT